MNEAPPAQRLRVHYASDDSVKYVGHLDIARTWERAIRRSGLPLAYSHGFNPQPRIQFAAALPLGFTSDAEVVDIYLRTMVAPEEALERLRVALPRGIAPRKAETVAYELPSLQSLVQRAHYRVEVETDDNETAFRTRLEAFDARTHAWRERRKGKETVRYDLRPLVLEIVYAGACPLGQSFEVWMRSEPGASGRPDELLAELGFPEAARRIQRTALVLAADPVTESPNEA